MSRFWRSEYERLIAEHHAAGHVMPGARNCLDDAYLDASFWRVAERAAQEQREYGRDEFFAELHEAKAAHQAEQNRRYVAGVMRGVEHRRWLAVRRGRIRLRMEMIERGISPLTEREKLALRRLDLRRRVAEMELSEMGNA